jgi:hypothetical protein
MDRPGGEFRWSLMPDQPDERDASAGRGKPGYPQDLGRHLQRPRRGALHALGKQRIKTTFDDQDQGKRGPQIAHWPIGFGSPAKWQSLPHRVPGFAAGAAAGVPAPAGRSKYRKKLLSGFNTKDVVLPPNAAR